MSLLRASELDRARATCETAMAAGHGGIIFIAGSPAIGRTAMLGGLAEELPGIAGSPRIVSGRFVEGRYVAWPSEAPNAEVVSAVEGALGLAGAALPLLGLVAQAVSVSRAAARALESLGRRRTEPTVEKTFHVLRAAARDRPVVCLVDDCDEADGTWWSDLLLGFANEICRELPLFLFLVVEGGAEPGPHLDDEPDALFAARHLTERGLAEWWELRPVEPQELLALTGPAEGDVVGRLCELTDGRPGWAAELWNEWRAGGVVERDTDLGHWRFAPDQPGTSPTILEVARDRIRQRVGGDLATASNAWRVLSCAALEGRYFTADAVAAALRMDRDEVIDLLDDDLAISSSATPGLVEEVGPVNATDPAGREQHVWRYRFTSQLFRTAFIRFGLTPGEREELSGLLARSLERIYGTEAPAIALRLAVLYRTAGDDEMANHYRRQAGSHMPSTVIIDQARALLDNPEVDTWDRAQCRRATLILGDAARLFSSLGALDEAVAALQLAAVVARRADMAADEADAVMMLGVMETYTGAPDAARSHLESAAAIWRTIGRLDGEAESLKHLAWLDGLAGNRALALESLHQSLALLRKLGLHDRVMELHLHKANLALRLDDVDLAEEALQAASRLAGYAPPLQHASMIEKKGVIAVRRHDYEAALVHYRRAAKLYRDLGERRQEASVTRGIGIALVGAGKFDEARRVLAEAVATAQSMENIAGEAEARYGLGQLELAAQDPQAGLRQLEESARLYREAGQNHTAAELEAEVAAAREAAQHEPDPSTTPEAHDPEEGDYP